MGLNDRHMFNISVQLSIKSGKEWPSEWRGLYISTTEVLSGEFKIPKTLKFGWIFIFIFYL